MNIDPSRAITSRGTHTLGGPWWSTVLLRISVEPCCMFMNPKVLTVLQLISTRLLSRTVWPRVIVKRPSRKAQSSQKGPCSAAAVAAAAAGAALGFSSGLRGAPAAAAAASAAGESDVIVRFRSRTVAGNAGLAGNGHVSRFKVTCSHANTVEWQQDMWEPLPDAASVSKFAGSLLCCAKASEPGCCCVPKVSLVTDRTNRPTS